MKDCLLPYLQSVLISLIYFKMSLGSEFIKPTFAIDLNKFALVIFLCYTPPGAKAEIVGQ